MTKDEFKALEKFVRTFPTVVDSADSIGIHRNVLDAVLLKRSGSPKTINMIRKKLEAVA